jgi:hypothetical protein
MADITGNRYPVYVSREELPVVRSHGEQAGRYVAKLGTSQKISGDHSQSAQENPMLDIPQSFLQTLISQRASNLVSNPWDEGGYHGDFCSVIDHRPRQRTTYWDQKAGTKIVETKNGMMYKERDVKENHETWQLLAPDRFTRFALKVVGKML